MRAELEIILQNLHALKDEGMKEVFVDDETLEELRERVAAATAEEKVFSAKKSAVPAREREVPAPAAKKESVFEDFTFTKAKETLPEKKEEAEAAPAFDFSVSEARAACVPAEGSNAERLSALREQMLGDPVCNAHLHAGKKLVFGTGNPEAEIFFCGEAPGAEEETQGEPFVGPAGQLLTKMILATGLQRENVYIGNIMKWRPEMPTSYGNRPPTPDEMRYCLPYLAKQTEIIRPKVIVALGLTAINGLLGFDPERRIGAMRGKKLFFHEIPVVATYHPSYLLRNDSVKSKRAAWEDFLEMMKIAELPISERQRNFFLPKKV